MRMSATAGSSTWTSKASKCRSCRTARSPNSPRSARLSRSRRTRWTGLITYPPDRAGRSCHDPTLEGQAPIHTGPKMNSAWRRRLTLVAMCIAQGMILLDVTIVNVALPSIQRELHESSGELEWVISAYALSLAALIPLSGSLGDRFGRKRFFAAGMVVFTLGSVACALSASAPDLIGARAIQGVGGAIMSALGLSILSETYSGTARAGAIGIWATVAGLGFGLGPVVGGLLLGVFGWSSIFWVNVPFALAGIALTVTVVPESRNPDTRPVDVPGVLTSAAGLLALTFGLIESTSNSWTSAPVAAPLAAGLVLLASFVWWEHRAPVPMIPSAVVKLRSFTTSCGVYLLSYASLTGVYFYLTLLYQDVDGWTARIRATRQPQTRAGRSSGQACTTRRPR